MLSSIACEGQIECDREEKSFILCYGMECIGIDSEKWNREGDKNE